MKLGPSMRRAVLAFSAFSALAAAGAVAPVWSAEPTRTAALPAAAPQRPQVVDLRFGRHGDKTRIVIELSEHASFKIETLSGPPRVAVGFGDLAPGKGALAEGPGVDLVERYHQDDENGGRRLIFTGSTPLRVREAFMIPPQEGRRTRLVIDLERADKDETSFSAANGVQLTGSQNAAAPPANKGGKPTAPAALTPPVRTAALPGPPPGTPTQKPNAAKPAKPPLIVLDPGHGGGDPGAIGVGGVYEKEITLAAARELRRQLLATGRYRVKLTRDSDVFIRLRDRVALAREAEADLFISLHADTLGSDQVRGLSIYTLSGKASDREAEMLAAKENRADAIVGMDLSTENQLVASILIDLAQRDTMNHSKRFAAYALSHLSKDVRILASKPQREAGFAVLTAPDVPSVLVEMGYLSNPTDAKLLVTQAHREKLTKDMVNAVDAYFGWLGTGRR